MNGVVVVVPLRTWVWGNDGLIQGLLNQHISMKLLMGDPCGITQCQGLYIPLSKLYNRQLSGR